MNKRPERRPFSPMRKSDIELKPTKEFETVEQMQSAYTRDLQQDRAALRFFMDHQGGMTPHLTDELLGLLIKDGFTQKQIATRFNFSQPSISRRVASAYSNDNIEYEQMLASDPKISAISDPEKATEAAKKLWDAKLSYEQNYAELLNVAATSVRASDRIRALAEIRKYLDSAQKATQALYNADRVNRFMDAVVNVIRQYDPDVQYKVATALASRRGGLMPLPSGATVDAPTLATLEETVTPATNELLREQAPGTGPSSSRAVCGEIRVQRHAGS